MKSLSIYKIYQPKLQSIKDYFKLEYGFSVSNASAVKYVVKNIDTRYIQPVSIAMEYKVELPEMRIEVDDETYNRFQEIYMKPECVQFRSADVLSAFVLHLHKMLTG